MKEENIVHLHDVGIEMITPNAGQAIENGACSSYMIYIGPG